MLSAFPYPGGKTPYVTDILHYFPEHRRYVEPFGGSAALLLNKPESYIEVYNDANSDVVHFFRTVREHREELEDWLRTVPFSREVYEDWVEDYFSGYRPEDDVERAGRWFYLRYTQYGGKVGGRSGFKASGKRNEARSFRGGIEALDEVVERFAQVTVENADYREVIDRYDGDEAFFYVDPPYVGPGDILYDTEFDHGALATTLANVDGRWLCSYGDRAPDALVEIATHVGTFDAMYSLGYTVDEGRVESEETLLANYDPTDEPGFSEVGQATLGDTCNADTERGGEG